MWLPEPGTAAEWTEGGFGSSFSHRKVKHSPFDFFVLGATFHTREKRLFETNDTTAVSGIWGHDIGS